MTDVRSLVHQMTLKEQDVLLAFCANKNKVITAKELAKQVGMNTQQLGGILSKLKKEFVGPNYLIAVNGKCKDGWLWSLDISQLSTALLKKTLDESYQKTLSYRLK